MNVTPLAIHGVILLETQVFRNRTRFFFGSFNQKNVSLVETMRRNMNVIVSETIRLSASRTLDGERHAPVILC